jgi:hypothetical protein
MFPCPCCGYVVFKEPPGSFDICPICYWEDDIVQLAFPDLEGGANACSLMDGQRTFARVGACEERCVDVVRSPRANEIRSVGWRPLEPQRDRYLHWSVPEDHVRWKEIKSSTDVCLYYWLPDYWL